jgi:tRNA A37 methylthiotransferase MiaB
MRDVLDKSAAAYQAGFLDQTASVLWENVKEVSPRGWFVSGLTDNYLRVSAQASQDLWNQITQVHVTGVASHGLTGRIATPSS